MLRSSSIYGGNHFLVGSKMSTQTMFEAFLAALPGPPLPASIYTTGDGTYKARRVFPCLVRRISFPNMSGTKSCTESMPSGSFVMSLTFFIQRAPAATKPGGSWLLPATLHEGFGGTQIIQLSGFKSLA